MSASVIEHSPLYTVHGTQLTSYDGDEGIAVLPHGIESVADDFLANWIRPAEFRGRVIFPDSLRALSWRQLRRMDDVRIDLPAGFLRADGGDSEQEAARPLGNGWADGQITLGSAVRAYLLKDQKDAALAQSVITEEDAAQAAKLMTAVLRARAAKKNKRIPQSVLLRAVIFFIRYVQEIPLDTVRKLVRLLPNGKSEAIRMPQPVFEGLVPYHPALLDYILRAVSIDPGNFAFSRRVRELDGQKSKVSALEVKSAIVPYIAAGLDVAISDNASTWLPWAHFDYTADMYSAGLKDLEIVVRTIVPGFDSNETPRTETFDCAVLVGRFGSRAQQWKMKTWLEDLESDSKQGLQVLTGIALQAGIPDRRDLESYTAYTLLQRHVEASTEAWWRGQLLYVGGFNGDERQASTVWSVPKGKEWDIVVGPELQTRWRFHGEKKLRTVKEMRDIEEQELYAPDTSLWRAASEFLDMESYLSFFKESTDAMLQELYFTDTALPASTIQHALIDLTLLQAVCGVVWEQNGATFTLTALGPVNARGETTELSEDPVRIAYAPQMDPEEVSAWKGYFQDRKYDSWMGHMEEPDYRTEQIAVDRFSNISIKDADLARKKMMPVLYSKRGKIYTRTLLISICFGRYRGEITLGSVKVDQMTRIVNRILFQLDLATLEKRIQRDDPTILPVLERAPLKTLRKARKIALESDAVQVKAAILAMMDDHGETHARDRFSLALR